MSKITYTDFINALKIIDEYRNQKVNEISELELKLDKYRQKNDAISINKTLRDLELPAKILNPLLSCGIRSLNKLILSDSRDLLKIRGFGKKGLHELRTKLKSLNLYFTNEMPL